MTKTLTIITCCLFLTPAFAEEIYLPLPEDMPLPSEMWEEAGGLLQSDAEPVVPLTTVPDATLEELDEEQR